MKNGCGWQDASFRLCTQSGLTANLLRQHQRTDCCGSHGLAAAPRASGQAGRADQDPSRKSTKPVGMTTPTPIAMMKTIRSP
jgi:hypothetical protein